MKKVVIIFVLCSVLPLWSWGGEVDSLGKNCVFLGVGMEVTSWIERPVEPLWRVGSELLVPCGQHLSIGAFAGSAFLQWDAGMVAGWCFDDNSLVMAGLGYSATYDTPILRLGYKTRRAWYFTATMGADMQGGECHIGLGVGYALLGGRR